MWRKHSVVHSSVSLWIVLVSGMGQLHASTATEERLVQPTERASHSSVVLTITHSTATYSQSVYEHRPEPWPPLDHNPANKTSSRRLTVFETLPFDQSPAYIERLLWQGEAHDARGYGVIFMLLQDRSEFADPLPLARTATWAQAWQASQPIKSIPNESVTFAEFPRLARVSDVQPESYKPLTSVRQTPLILANEPMDIDDHRGLPAYSLWIVFLLILSGVPLERAIRYFRK